MKRHFPTWKETYWKETCLKRDNNMKRDLPNRFLPIFKETYLYETRLTYMKETNLHQKTLFIYMKRDVYTYSEIYIRLFSCIYSEIYIRLFPIIRYVYIRETYNNQILALRYTKYYTYSKIWILGISKCQNLVVVGLFSYCYRSLRIYVQIRILGISNWKHLDSLICVNDSFIRFQKMTGTANCR